MYNNWFYKKSDDRPEVKLFVMWNTKKSSGSAIALLLLFLWNYIKSNKSSRSGCALCGESDGTTFDDITFSTEIEALENFVFILLSSFGFYFHSWIFLAIVGDREIKTDDGAIRMFEDREVTLRRLDDISIVFACSCCTGRIKLLRKHDSYIDRISLNPLDMHHFKIILSRDGKNGEEEKYC